MHFVIVTDIAPQVLSAEFGDDAQIHVGAAALVVEDAGLDAFHRQSLRLFQVHVLSVFRLQNSHRRQTARPHRRKLLVRCVPVRAHAGQLSPTHVVPPHDQVRSDLSSVSNFIFIVLYYILKYKSINKI